MSRTNLILGIFVLLAVSSTAVNAQNGPAHISEFSAVSTFDPFNMFQNGVVGYYTDFGTLSCPGNEPTGDPAQPCPPGSRIHYSGVKWLARVDSAEARFRGWLAVDVSVRWAPDMTGPAFGKYTLYVDNNGGTWNGTCAGQFTIVEGQWTEGIHCYGHGSGGIVDGQQVIFSGGGPRYTPLAYTQDLEVKIIDPSSN